MPLTITDDDFFVALSAFILNVTPLTRVNVQQGQQNRSPMPPGPNFAIMTAADRSALATTVRDYDPAHGARLTSRPTQVGVFVNFYGPDATDNGQVFNQLFRDLYGTDFFASYGVQPLWCDDGKQMPLVDGEEQYETRWMIHALLQITPTVSTSQDFADSVAIKIVEAD